MSDLETQVRRMYDAWDDGRVADLVPDDFEFTSDDPWPGFEATYRGKGVARFHEMVMEMFREWSTTVERVMALESGNVLVLVTFRATGAQSGAPLETPWAHIHEFADGRLVRTKPFATWAAALDEAGLAQ